MRKVLLLILVTSATTAFSQDWPLKKMVMEKKAINLPFKNITAFSFTANKSLGQGGTYQELSIDPSFIKQLLVERPAAIHLTIPLNDKISIDFDLVQYSLGNIKFTENNARVIPDIKNPLTYRGIISGEQNKNSVTFTVNDDYLSLAAVMNSRVLQVTKGGEKGNNIYRLYNSETVKFPTPASINCGTPDRPASKTINGIDLTGYQALQAPSPKCVNIFIDCFDSLYYQNSSSKQKTVSYVYELFNAVATGYYNEQVNIQVAAINVWTTPDPYRGDNRTNALADLAAYYKDNFFGNICVGLDFSSPGNGRSGLAGSIGRVKATTYSTCPAYTASDNEFCYCDLDYSVSVANFPVTPNTTGQQIYLVMHEIGHLLGAHHTKWCGWKLTSNPDTYGTLDSCGVIEGTCAQGPAPGSNGATIMSYCVTDNTTNYVNFNNGFGLLPGNAIRNFIDQTTCLLNCSDCFGWLPPYSNYTNRTLAFNYYEHVPMINTSRNGRTNGNGEPGNKPDNTNLFITSKKIKQ